MARFLLEGKSIAAMSGEGERSGGLGENFCLKESIQHVSSTEKKKTVGRTPVRNLNNSCCGLQINDDISKIIERLS